MRSICKGPWASSFFSLAFDQQAGGTQVLGLTRSDTRDSWQREQLTGTSGTSGMQTVTSGSSWSNSTGSGSSGTATVDHYASLAGATVLLGLTEPTALLGAPPGVSLVRSAPLSGATALPATLVPVYGVAGEVLPVATAAWPVPKALPGPGSGWQLQIGCAAGQAIIMTTDQLGPGEIGVAQQRNTQLLGQGLQAASLLGFSPTMRWTWFGAHSPELWAETSNAYVQSWAVAVAAQPGGDPLMMPDGKRGGGSGGDKGLERGGGFWDFLVGAAQSVNSFVVGLVTDPGATLYGLAAGVVDWIGSNRDNILGAMQWLGDHALNPFGAIGELGAMGLYQVGSGIAWALEKTGEGLGDMAVSFMEYGHAVSEFASSLSQVGHAKDTGGDLVDDFDKMLMGRLRAQANGFDVGSLTAGDLPIYGLDGNQTVSQAAGSLRQGLEQAGALVAGGVQLAAQVLAFTPVGTAVMTVQTAIQLAEGDVVGAALSVGQIFVMHGVNSVSASFGVSNLGALPARAINFSTGFAVGAGFDALNQVNAIARGDQTDFDVGRMFASGFIGGVTNSMFAETCFTGDMPIETPWGSQRIDQFRKGDLLLSRWEGNPFGAIEVKVVEEVFVSFSRIMKLRIKGKYIKTTLKHPFFVQNLGWVAAWRLRSGDKLSTRSGQWIVLEAVIDDGEWAPVYNLRVSDYHTYFAGCPEWGFAVWTHNAKCAFDWGDEALEPFEHLQGKMENAAKANDPVKISEVITEIGQIALEGSNNRTWKSGENALQNGLTKFNQILANHNSSFVIEYQAGFKRTGKLKGVEVWKRSTMTASQLEAKGGGHLFEGTIWPDVVLTDLNGTSRPEMGSLLTAEMSLQMSGKSKVEGVFDLSQMAVGPKPDKKPLIFDKYLSAITRYNLGSAPSSVTDIRLKNGFGLPFTN